MNEEKQDYIDELKSFNDPIEEWPTSKLKKEVNSGGSDMDPNLAIDDIGIE